MEMIKVVVVDDEEKAINVLQTQIRRHFNNIEVVATCSDSEKAHSIILEAKPDLVFLDIEMPIKSGFGVLMEFEIRNFEVVFVTAYDQYAIEAFKQNAIGYILKPVDRDDFIRTVTMALIRIEQKTPTITDELTTNLKKKTPSNSVFTVYNDGERVVLKQNEVIYCRADGSYCELKTTSKKFVISKNMKFICDSMPAWNFVKVNRSFVINPNHILRFNKKEGGSIILSDETSIRVSKRIRKQVFATLKDDFNIF